MKKHIVIKVDLKEYIKIKTLASSRNLSIKHMIISLINQFFQEEDNQKILRNLPS